MKEKFGFLYNGYQTDRWFWEFIVVFRKVGLVMISVFLVANVQVQALAALFLCALCIMLHVLYTPFSTPMMDIMEFLSLVSSFGTFFCGQFLFAKGLGETTYLAASVVILLLNILFFAAFAYCFGSLMYDKCCKDKDADELEEQAKKQKEAAKRAATEQPLDIDDVSLRYRKPAVDVDAIAALETEAAEKEKADRDKAVKAAADASVLGGVLRHTGNLGFGLGAEREPTEEEKKQAQEEKERARERLKRASKRQRIKEEYHAMQQQNCIVM